MSRTLRDGSRDELEAVVALVIAAATTAPTKTYHAAYGALSIAGSLGMFCHCTTTHDYLQPLLDSTALSLKEAAVRFLNHDKCRHKRTNKTRDTDEPKQPKPIEPTHPADILWEFLAWCKQRGYTFDGLVTQAELFKKEYQD